MFKLVVLVSLLVSGFNSALGSVPGEQSLECHSPDSTVTRVYLDVWMTGHPMGGFLSFEGVMSVDGHKALATPNLMPFNFQGSTDDLSRLDYMIAMDGMMRAALNVDVTTDLKHRVQAYGIQAAGEWISESVVCRWIL